MLWLLRRVSTNGPACKYSRLLPALAPKTISDGSGGGGVCPNDIETGNNIQIPSRKKTNRYLLIFIEILSSLQPVVRFEKMIRSVQRINDRQA
jgi:hypothetical protein